MIVPSIDLEAGHAVQLVGGADQGARRRRPAPARPPLRPGRRDRGGRSRRRARPRQQRRRDRGPDRSRALPGRRRHPQRHRGDPLARPRRPQGRSRHRRPARGAGEAAARARDRGPRRAPRRGRRRGLAEADRGARARADRGAPRAGRRLSRDLRRARRAPRGHRPRVRKADPGRRRHGQRSRSRAGSRPRTRSASSTGSAAMPRSAWRSIPAGSASPRRSPRRSGATGRTASGRPWWSTSGATALGLCYSDLASLGAALEQGRGVYHSRTRGLWVKGETSGATQELLGIDADCDRDTLRFTVRQQPPGFCHLDTRSCWGPDRGLGALARRLAERRTGAPPGSYTARLFADPELLGAKLREEAAELAEAETREHVVHEAADRFLLHARDPRPPRRRSRRGRGGARPPRAQGDPAGLTAARLPGASDPDLKECDTGVREY